ncbi:MAG: hypothetical protein EXR72_17700 [Myxococcales bacterium]|nr:hypothetical protein [Myxococcales bacterium]
MSRIDSIRKIVELQPNDPFPRYGLAMELKNGGLLAESTEAFDELERRHPDYLPQYLMHFNVLTSLQRKDDARSLAERGLVAIRKKGDGHAQGELQAALDALSDED